MRLLLISVALTSSFFAVAQEPPKEGYLLKSIYFDGGSYLVDDVQFNELRQFVDSLGNIYDYTLSIHSHTDNIGGVRYNQWLSNMRADAVIQMLLYFRFERNQIEKRAFGQYNPVFDNSTWEGRRKNRRVDIIFWPIVM